MLCQVAHAPPHTHNALCACSYSMPRGVREKLGGQGRQPADNAGESEAQPREQQQQQGQQQQAETVEADAVIEDSRKNAAPICTEKIKAKRKGEHARFTVVFLSSFGCIADAVVHTHLTCHITHTHTHPYHS